MTDTLEATPARKFDRRVQFDERSRNFPVRALVPNKPRSYTWSVPVHLNQRAEGACVGFGFAHDAAARPVSVRNVTDQYARDLYHEAQKLDPWDGEDYEGTSVLAGAKAAQARGLIAAYHWALGPDPLEDLRLAIAYKGPAILGVNWRTGMMRPDGQGHIHPTGEIEGGHCILAFSVSETRKRIGLWNSWGAQWGLNGMAWVSFDEMDQLLHDDGEACIPITRLQPGLPR